MSRSGFSFLACVLVLGSAAHVRADAVLDAGTLATNEYGILSHGNGTSSAPFGTGWQYVPVTGSSTSTSQNPSYVSPDITMSVSDSGTVNLLPGPSSFATFSTSVSSSSTNYNDGLAATQSSVNGSVQSYGSFTVSTPQRYSLTYAVGSTGSFVGSGGSYFSSGSVTLTYEPTGQPIVNVSSAYENGQNYGPPSTGTLTGTLAPGTYSYQLAANTSSNIFGGAYYPGSGIIMDSGNGSLDLTLSPLVSVPEPNSLSLLSIGAALAVGFTWRKRRLLQPV